jgi:antitoxin component YwqK of YwqJK toxin-antitoxin module
MAVYYAKGVVDTEIPFKDDRKHGEGYQYDKNGIIIAILTYKYGQLIDKTIINRVDEKGRKQGVFRTFYPDKKVKTECYYKDDYMNGYYREYDSKGKEVKIARYIMGELQNEDRNSLADTKEAIKLKNEYYPDGSVKQSGGYKDSIPVGVHRIYNEKGKIKGGVTYDNNGNKIADGIVDGKGREQGKWVLYDTTGYKSANGSYKNGKREGQWYFYFSNGNTEQEGVYKDGNPEGKWIWYYNDGKKRREEFFAKGKEDGQYCEFSISGDTLQAGEYVLGEKEGLWRTNTGDALLVENFSDGAMHGEYLVYYMPDKTLKVQAKYLQGNLHGVYREYYSNGKTSVEGEYVAGNQNGVWKYFTEDGLLESTIEYSQGVVVKVDGNSMPVK